MMNTEIKEKKIKYMRLERMIDFRRAPLLKVIRVDTNITSYPKSVVLVPYNYL